MVHYIVCFEWRLCLSINRYCWYTETGGDAFLGRDETLHQIRAKKYPFNSSVEMKCDWLKIFSADSMTGDGNDTRGHRMTFVPFHYNATDGLEFQSTETEIEFLRSMFFGESFHVIDKIIERNIHEIATQSIESTSLANRAVEISITSSLFQRQFVRYSIRCDVMPHKPSSYKSVQPPCSPGLKERTKEEEKSQILRDMRRLQIQLWKKL